MKIQFYETEGKKEKKMATNKYFLKKNMFVVFR